MSSRSVVGRLLMECRVECRAIDRGLATSISQEPRPSKESLLFLGAGAADALAKMLWLKGGFGTILARRVCADQDVPLHDLGMCSGLGHGLALSCRWLRAKAAKGSRQGSPRRRSMLECTWW